LFVMARTSNNDFHNISSRLFWAKCIACFGLSLLAGRLWYLQAVQGSYYRDLSTNNRTRTIRTAAARGDILDREGRVLVRNRPSFDISLLLEDTPDIDKTIERLAEITKRDPAELKQRFASRRKGRRFEPQVVLPDVSRSELAMVKVNTHNLPGVIVTASPTRSYPDGSLAAQIFGYTREITKSQLAQRKADGYKAGDVIGQSGLEKAFEDVLHGASGFKKIEVDAVGRRKRELGIVDNITGSHIYLTLDVDLQRAAQDALGDFKGAVVALDPRSGEILALASTPSFDVNMFSGQMSSKVWNEVVNDERKPLTNRTISNIYPPGSTIKLLWGVAGLADGLIRPETRKFCPGFFKLGGRRYHCHKRAGHGWVNLREAIRVSCNVFFYELGQEIGISRLSDYMEKFGFGEKSGIVLSGEEVGTRPSERWKLRRFGERWYPGDTLPVAIGQGYLVVTPLQLAVAISSIANGGTVYRPQLISKIVDAKGNVVEKFEPRARRTLGVDPAALKLVREYAEDVVGHERGTAGKARIEGVRIGGKTGTAQVGALGTEKLGERFKDHAWFVSFAPVEDPTLVLVVLVENSGHGGTYAAPVAKKVYEAYFRKKGVIPYPEVIETEEGLIRARLDSPSDKPEEVTENTSITEVEE
jgi:penicillin-binding protein 2